MNFFKKISLGLTMLFYSLPVYAQYGLKESAKVAKLKKSSIPEVVGSVIGIALSLIGVIFMVLLVYGGFLWMTSYGNEQKVTKAKDLITSAIIGLVVVVSAYAISNFVLDALIGTTAAPTTTK